MPEYDVVVSVRFTVHAPDKRAARRFARESIKREVVTLADDDPEILVKERKPEEPPPVWGPLQRSA